MGALGNTNTEIAKRGITSKKISLKTEDGKDDLKKGSKRFFFPFGFPDLIKLFISSLFH